VDQHHHKSDGRMDGASNNVAIAAG
jgi:hypothetical protein